MITIIIATSTTLPTYEQNKQKVTQKYNIIELKSVLSKDVDEHNAFAKLKNIIYKAVKERRTSAIAILNNAFKNSNLIAVYFFFIIKSSFIFILFNSAYFFNFPKSYTFNFDYCLWRVKEQCLCLITKYEKTWYCSIIDHCLQLHNFKCNVIDSMHCITPTVLYPTIHWHQYFFSFPALNTKDNNFLHLPFSSFVKIKYFESGIC